MSYALQEKQSVSVEELTSWSPRIENYGEGKVLRCKYRGKLVAATPEEVVRQRVLYHLIDVAKWPRRLIAVEFTQHLASGGRRRPDILLFDEKAQPCVIVECKRPEIPLDQSVFSQAEKYATNKERAMEIWLTNGTNNLFYRKVRGDWKSLGASDRLVKIAGDVPSTPTHLPDFNSRRSIEDYWQRQSGLEHLAQKEHAGVCDFALAVHKIIHDLPVKLPYSYKGVHLLEDRGVRPQRFGTAGGSWWGLYRNFLVATEGRVEAAAIGLHRWQSATIDDVILCVGFIKESRMHHALQLHFTNCDLDKRRDWNVWHNAEMQRTPRKKVIEAVVEAGSTHLLGPEWDWEKGKWARRVKLGKLRHPATANWKNTRDFVANLLHYGIIRTNLREAA